MLSRPGTLGQALAHGSSVTLCTEVLQAFDVIAFQALRFQSIEEVGAQVAALRSRRTYPQHERCRLFVISEERALKGLSLPPSL